MDLGMQEMKAQYSFEEDDGFYDELRRQVLQLTAEDDDDDVVENIVYDTKATEARKRGPNSIPKSVCYNGWPGNKEDCAATATPAWIANLWRSRSGHGTGVFIPQAVQSRRKNRSRKKNNDRGRTYRKVERMNL